MKILGLIIVLATGSILSADIATSVTCTVGGLNNTPGSTVTDPNNCSLQSVTQQPSGYPSMASATANANFALAPDPNSFSSLSVNQNALTSSGTDNNQSLISSSANSQVSINEALLTAGTVRSGFVEINASVDLEATLHNGASHGSLGEFSLGPIEISCLEPTGAPVVTNCTAYVGSREQTHQLPVNGAMFPFTLGQAFSLNYSSSANGVSYTAYNGNGFGRVSTQFQFLFFEADGVTPVAVEAAPEPATFALFGMALGVLGIGTQKFRRCFTSRQGFSEPNSGHV